MKHSVRPQAENGWPTPFRSWVPWNPTYAFSGALQIIATSLSKVRVQEAGFGTFCNSLHPFSISLGSETRAHFSGDCGWDPAPNDLAWASVNSPSRLVKWGNRFVVTLYNLCILQTIIAFPKFLVLQQCLEILAASSSHRRGLRFPGMLRFDSSRVINQSGPFPRSCSLVPPSDRPMYRGPGI